MDQDARSAVVRARRLLSLNRKIQACNRAMIGLSRARQRLDPDARIRAAQKIFALHRDLRRALDQSGELELEGSRPDSNHRVQAVRRRSA